MTHLLFVSVTNCQSERVKTSIKIFEEDLCGQKLLEKILDNDNKKQ